MKKIEQGDKVIIEFLGPDEKPFGEAVGILTKIWDDEPYCMLDGQNIDLAGEAHTTRVGLIPDKKILIIGQAPPSAKQYYPYDTTMFYDWLENIRISKAHAQHIFEFEAMYNEFPGYDAQNNHLKPTLEQMNAHFEKTLKSKIESADKVLVLGNVARDYLNSKTSFADKQVTYLIHPSKRNYSLYWKNESEILKQLKQLING